MTIIMAGTYDAKLLGYGIVETKGGEPNIVFKFGIIDDQKVSHQVYWQGSFKTEKSQELTLKALKTAGLPSPDDIPKLAANVESGLLNTEKDYSVVVEHDYDERDPTKVYPRVRWVNDKEGLGGGRKYIDEAQSKKLMASISLKGMWSRITSGEGAGSKPAQTAPLAPAGSLDDIPF